MNKEMRFCKAITSIFSTLLACSVAVGIIYGMTSWAMGLLRLGNINLDRIDDYGDEYPLCDIIDQEFVSYQYLNCTGSCEQYCIEKNIIAEEGIDCIIIRVYSFEKGFMDISFTDCYSAHTIDWSSLEERGTLNGSYISACIGLFVGCPFAIFFIFYYTKKFCNCCETFVFSNRDIELEDYPSKETT